MERCMHKAEDCSTSRLVQVMKSYEGTVLSVHLYTCICVVIGMLIDVAQIRAAAAVLC